MNLYKFSVIVTPTVEDGETYYQVSVPVLPEVITCGDSLEEAVYMAQDALELVVLSRLEEGESIPSDKKPIRLEKGSILKEVLVSVVHDVHSTPVTENVRFAFA
ncbi:MAG: hypothetical protein G01um101416_568 [Microgenomates group bacterium Gr01-1014_16]|nr:MAG: hypothetical protein G01um101416_568 [Microgenomates group bacterium Gr01-1014_16]